MSGEWTATSPHWWSYRIPGLDRPYGHVVQHRRDGPDGAEGAESAVWDAVVMVGCAAGDDDDDTTIAEGVSLDEAKAAIERHAADHVGHA